MNIDKFINDQLSVWPVAAANFRALKNVETKKLHVNGLDIMVQHNPERIRSSAAKTDSASVMGRKCFLCAENRPPEQMALKFEGRKGRKYDILINPYPIFPKHIVIAGDSHSPQSIWHRLTDMTDIARHYPAFTVFYNGPKCGASAPDHLHFQACPRGMMPLENDVDSLLNRTDSQILEYVTSVQEAKLYHYGKFTKGVFVLAARTSKSMSKLFYRLLDCLPQREGETEPMFNLLLWYKVNDEKPVGISHGRFGEYRAILLARDRHRSHHYFSDGPDHLTMSPGCADMAGLFVAPDACDYAKLNAPLLSDMLSEVSVSQEVEKDIIWKLTRTQPELQVGIMSGREIEFEIISDGAGRQRVMYENGRISYNGTLYDELVFDSQTVSSMFAEPTFILYGVTIGVDFHWERRQTQKFAGLLKFVVSGDNVTAVNVIGVEDYLLSVISSEMKASAPLEYLKAHAVISRSWVMKQIRDRKTGLTVAHTSVAEDYTDGETRHLVRWFDREAHKDFDVCADDHCQRYQGLGAIVGSDGKFPSSRSNVARAVDETWGQVLTYDGELCDTRFSKCCGGMMERFGSCWEDIDYPYLAAMPDSQDTEADSASGSVASGGRQDALSGTSAETEPAARMGAVVPDLSIEENAEKWIMSSHTEAFCNTEDSDVLSQVLNGYDLETKDFFRWEETRTRVEWSELISRRSGQDIGLLEDLKPLRRGSSGRITLLSIHGTKSSMVIGKELVIRKFLSESHLKSSAFVVKVTPAAMDSEKSAGDRQETARQDGCGSPGGGASSGNAAGKFTGPEAPASKISENDSITLYGAGWGHGVGLCQIGAAIMSSRGCTCRQILAHYYPGAVFSRMNKEYES